MNKQSECVSDSPLVGVGCYASNCGATMPCTGDILICALMVLLC